MIRICLHNAFPKDVLSFDALTIQGHANSGEYGRDLVCCAISTLGIATLNTLTDGIGLRKWIRFEVREGYLDIRLDTKHLSRQQMHDAQVVINGFVINAEMLAKQHPNYIEIQQED